MKNNESKEPFLAPDEIHQQTVKRTKKYNNLNFFEQYALYIGIAQLLEICLKNLLVEKYQYDLGKLEKWTLGRTAKELEKNNLRKDFIQLLNSVVEYRNYIAHEMLANEILFHELLRGAIPKNHHTKETRRLHRAIYEIERLFFLFNWTQENDAWELEHCSYAE